MRPILPSCALLLLAGTAVAQNGDLNVVHGLPGLGGPVDVVVNGTTTFAGVTFGQTATASVAPGGYFVEIVQSGTVLLSENVSVAADESVTAAAHLALGGAPSLSVFDDDLSAVGLSGEGRITVRHLTDANFLSFGVDSGTTLIYSLLFSNGQETSVEGPASNYQVLAEEFLLAQGDPFPLSSNAISSGSVPLAADTGIIANIVGTPGTPTFSIIVQSVTLEPSTPVTPNACDLSLSGSLVGGSLVNGGDLTFDLSGASPNSLVIFFYALDNQPMGSFWNFTLDIGGATGARLATYGTADVNGDFSLTSNYPPIGVFGGSTNPTTIFSQAISLDTLGQSLTFIETCVSDIESFQLTLP